MRARRDSIAAGRAIWAMIVFLAGFTVLLTVVCRQFLIPALLTADDASARQRHQLSAAATLLLAVVLFILVVGIWLVFRVRRLFVAETRQRRKTEYIDVWAEAGKRMRTPPEDDPGQSH